jgi:Carboxypeptidase regulatory-like domain/TonB dependent receptor
MQIRRYSYNVRSLELFQSILQYSFIISIMVLLCVAATYGQSNGSFSGIIKDNTGAIVTGATVKVKSEKTGSERSTITNQEGFFSIQEVPPGIYKITATLSGFKTAQINSLEVAVGQIRTADITLEIGEVTAVVDVVSDESLPTIDQSSNRLGVNISAKEVEQLPVNGRNYSQLYLNAPGAVNTGTGNFNELRFNGRSNQQNQTKIDGVEASAIFDASPGYVTVQGSQFRLATSIENIQEFRVESSNYPAESGTGTGGQITVIGKSGGNKFKGSLFHYIRNDIFDARNFFDGAEKSPLRLNQFGGSLGGPILKDKLFFFGSYEGLRQRAGFNVIESTPSTAVRDFVGFYNGAAGDARGEAARLALGISTADADAAQARINALRATGIINSFTPGNGTAFSVGGLNNSAQLIQANRTAILDEDAFSGRIDYKINERFTFYSRYQQSRGKLLSPDGASGRFISAKQTPDNFVASLSQVYGNSTVNETKFGINRASTDLSTVVPAVSGLSGIDLASTSFRLTGNIVSPGVNGGAPTGFSEPGGLTRQSSAGNGRAQPIRPVSYSFIDNLSWTKGNHNFKFGGEVRLLKVSFDQLGGTVYSYGNLRDFVLNQNVTAAFIGDLSTPGNFSIATDPITTFSRTQTGLSTGEQHYLIGYGQDEWRIKPNLVLSYGLRYEFYSVNREKNNRAIVLDAATGKILPSDTNFYKTANNNFGPRIGLTWTPAFLGGKTVIRGGGGLFYGPGQYEDLIQPIESNVFRSTQTVAGGLSATTGSLVSNTAVVQSRFTPRAYDTNGYRVPERVGQYGISVQTELPGSTVLTVGYVGSQGRNLFLRSVTNTILPGQTVIQNGTALPTGFGVVNRCSIAPVNGVCGGQIVGVTTIRQFDVVGKRLDTATGTIVVDPTAVLQPFGEVDYKTSGGRDHYNSLQIQINRRFTQGLTLNAQYQFGKSYGNTQGSNDANTVQNPFDFAAEFGNNTFDVRQTGNITALYELPIGKGKRYELNGLANALLGGWQIGGVYNGRAGSPLNVLITRADTVAVCQNSAGCTVGTSNVPQGFVISQPATINATTPLPTGFIVVVNTPGGNASRNTRRPNIVTGVNPFLTIEGSNLRFLNPAAFATPAPGTYGNLPRNLLKGPQFHQLDITLQKRFKINERTNIEFRSEIYNILNRANFANPSATLPNNLSGAATSLQPNTPFSTANSGQFGVINGTVGRTVGLGTNRQLQFALRLNF